MDQKENQGDRCSPEEIQQDIAVLKGEYEVLYNLVNDAQSRMGSIRHSIGVIQAKCLHGETEQHLLQNGGEMRLYRFCKICGAQR